MEKHLDIKTRDKKIVYGILNYNTGKEKSVVIFVHGFTGHSNEHIFFNAVNFFNNKGLATYRLNLYSGMKNSRKMRKSTIETHVQDTEDVINNLKSKYKNVYIVGHSIGGAVVAVTLSKNKNIKAGVLWEPSYNPKNFAKGMKYIKELNSYLLDWGTEYVIGKPMHESLIKFHEKETYPQLGNTPVKIILAEKGDIIEAGKKYYNDSKKPKSLVYIPKATHCFDEEGTEKKLFQETYNWIKKYDK